MEKKTEFVFVAFIEDEVKENKLFTKKISDKCVGFNITQYDNGKKEFNYSFILPKVFVKKCKQGEHKDMYFISLPSDFEIKTSVWDYDAKKSKSVIYAPKLLSKRISHIRQVNLDNLPTPKEDVNSKISINDDDLPF